MADDIKVSDPTAFGRLHPMSPIVKSAAGAALMGFPTFMAACLIHFQVLHRPPPASMWPLGIGALLGAVLIHVVPLPRRRQRIEWDGAEISVIDTHGRREIFRPEAISLVTGEAGLSLDGGEMIKWKRIHFLADGKRITTSLNQADAEGCFNALTRICLNAVCVSAWGKVQLGTPDVHNIPDWLGQTTVSIRAEFRRQSLRAFLMAVLCAAGGIGCTVLSVISIRDNQHQDDIGKAVVWAVILCVGSFLLACAAFRRVVRGRKISLSLRAAAQGQAIDPKILDRSI